MTTLKTLEHLLIDTRRIIKHQHELEKLKGEKFNIFSILGLESNENRTHSAFLGELLNPKGSHLSGDVFLTHFLNCVGITEFDTSTAQITPEYHIGANNYENKTGGRIDILIQDAYGRTISIENKIYAGDQLAQVERYCNFNKGKNAVLYLTLDGSEPSKESKGIMESGLDFQLISYKEHISLFLGYCIKEATETPMLRESIRQYKFLIKKLTSTMDKKFEQELIELMLRHYEESSYIVKNFGLIRQKLGDAVRTKIYSILQSNLGSIYTFSYGQPTSNTYSQIWISFKEFPASELNYGIESFSGLGWFEGNLFVGIFNHGDLRSHYDLMDGNSNNSKWWIDQYQIPDLSNIKINFSNPATLKYLSDSDDNINSIAEHIANEVSKYLDRKGNALVNYIKSQSF